MSKEHKKKIRKAFREAVFARDGHKCVFCDSTDGLDAHHITSRKEMPSGGYVAENGITVCQDHHLAVEKPMLKEHEAPSLYEKIGSTYEDAVRASERL